MRAAISLLVLLFCSGAQTRSTQTEVYPEGQSTGTAAAAAAVEVSTQLDVSAELKELRDMVVEQGVMLRYTQDEVMALEADNLSMKQRLADSESKVEVLEAENKAGRKENAAQEAELEVLKTRLAVTETEVENLEKEIKEAPKVAFSVGLTDSGYIESGGNDLDLVFSKVFTNVGQAYSSTSGFFTAPVRGVYYFRFTVMDFLDSRSMYIRMHKNGHQLMWLYEYDTDGHYNYLSSGLTLQLEKGDAVNLVLPTDRRLFDNADNLCNFSGFLLFPL